MYQVVVERAAEKDLKRRANARCCCSPRSEQEPKTTRQSQTRRNED